VSAGVNTAVNWCCPTVRVDVVFGAVPLTTSTGSPMLADPSLNCTVPVATAGVTVAVSVRGVPCGTGEAEPVVSAVLVAVAWLLLAGGARLNTLPVGDVPPVASNAVAITAAATTTPVASSVKDLVLRTIRIFLFRFEER
jgi:hypothetical protein